MPVVNLSQLTTFSVRSPRTLLSTLPLTCRRGKLYPNGTKHFGRDSSSILSTLEGRKHLVQALIPP